MVMRGDVPGLDQMLCDMLDHYQPGVNGVAGLAPALATVLPIPDWGVYSYLAYATVALSAAQSGTILAYTVPADRRAWIDSVLFQRQSGDNDWLAISIIPPTGYFEGTPATYYMLQLGAGATNIYWPDPGGKQTVDWIVPGPILCEPGTTVNIDPTGAGAGASVVRVGVRMLMMKAVRARLPTQ